MAVVDALRGFALFGILLVNMAGYSSPVSDLGESASWWKGRADRLVALLIENAGSGKFLFLFCLLFGLSFALQLMRAEQRGASFVPLYRRRLLALLLIGLLHGFLIWWADILVIFSVMGGLLFFFRSWKPNALLITVAALFLLSFVPWEASIIAGLRAASSQGAQRVSVKASTDDTTSEINAALRAYGTGGFREIERQRAHDVLNYYRAAALELPRDFPFFLLGLYIGRRKLFQNLPDHMGLFRKVRNSGFVLGLAGHVALFVLVLPGLPPWTKLLRPVVAAVALPATTFFYVSALVLLLQQNEWQRRLAPLVTVGRMSLSNYLFQSLVCTTIFYHYGFGLYGKVGPAKGVVFTVVIFVAQVCLSAWWLRRFRFGPVEWAWRSLTYASLQPMRLKAAAPGG